MTGLEPDRARTGCGDIHGFAARANRSACANSYTADGRQLQARIVLREYRGRALAAGSPTSGPDYAHPDAVTEPATCKPDDVAVGLD